ncbi:MAG: hypothetical protein JNL32_01835 [Candidatus Kapabacteria bacterium]|nr:hypothetical protein [Candidatus Kapabacteria bacterium]
MSKQILYTIFSTQQAQGLCSDTRKVWMYPVEYQSYAAGDAPLITTRANGSREFKIIDHLGGTRMVLSDNATRLAQTDYAPFGKVSWSSGLDERLSWIGKENDNESNLGDFGVRKYDEELGRFLSCDFYWEKYRGLTPYQYGENSSLTQKDPSGDSTTNANTTTTQGTTSTASVAVITTAAVVGGLLADDATVVGVLDDVVIPAVVVVGLSIAAYNYFTSSTMATVYVPPVPLERDENGKAKPSSPYPHTQLGTRESKSRPGTTYPQAREFDADGRPVRDIDFTDHGRPSKHTDPHEHKYDPNTGKRGPAQPVQSSGGIPGVTVPRLNNTLP